MQRVGVAFVPASAFHFLQRTLLKRFLTAALSPPALAIALVLVASQTAMAGEADLAIPELSKAHFSIQDHKPTGYQILFYGAFVICGTLGISLYLRSRVKSLPAHKSMLAVSEIIFQTCKTYLIHQGKFLLMLFVIIAAAM